MLSSMLTVPFDPTSATRPAVDPKLWPETATMCVS
jgi:hypothetical protein